MKKIIYAVMMILVVLQLVIGVYSVSNQEIIELSELENTCCESFFIPDNEMMSNPKRLFEVLKKVASDFHVNIVRTKLQKNDDGTYEVVKYILLTEDNSAYYNQFRMKSGGKLTQEDTQSDECTTFLASYETGKNEQSGMIQNNILDIHIIVKPLYQQFYYFKASGIYYAELPEGVTMDMFLEQLCQEFSNEFGVELCQNDVEGRENIVGLPYTDISYYKILLAVTMVMITVLVVYYILRESKNIAVMKLYGVSVIRIVADLEKNFYIVYLITVFLVYAVFILYKQSPFYVVQVIKESLAYDVVLFAAITIVGIVYVGTTEIKDALKNKSSTTQIIGINNIVKIICMFAMLYVGSSLYTDYMEIRQQKEILQNWNIADNYGVFYPYLTGNDQSKAERTDTEVAINNQLYKYMNEKGAIYVDASQYEDIYISQYAQRGWLSVKVNPNYLQAFSVYDENGKQVTVTEQQTNWVLLVPEMYKQQEDDMIEFFRQERMMYYSIDEGQYGCELRDEVKNQTIKIVWIKNNQSIFSFDTDVHTEQNNTIENAIIQVMTERNSAVSDRQCVLGNGINDPLKVKLAGDSRETYESLEAILMDLKLNDNLQYLVSVNERTSETLHYLYANIRLCVEMGILLLFMYIAVSVQNITILFDKNRKLYIIKKIFGYNWIYIYHRILKNNFTMIAVTFFLYYLYDRNWKYIVIVGGGVICIELLYIFISTEILERKKIVSVLKGE